MEIMTRLLTTNVKTMVLEKLAKLATDVVKYSLTDAIVGNMTVHVHESQQI
jgi:hypothetical protein